MSKEESPRKKVKTLIQPKLSFTNLVGFPKKTVKDDLQTTSTARKSCLTVCKY